MHHRLSGLSTYGLNGHRKGDEHPAYAPCFTLSKLELELEDDGLRSTEL